VRLRLIVVQEEHKQPVYLVTSVLDEADLSDHEASEIYALRWGIEVFFRTTKQTMQHHVMRSRTPKTCYLEGSFPVSGG
jgi:IS4 transposase